MRRAWIATAILPLVLGLSGCGWRAGSEDFDPFTDYGVYQLKKLSYGETELDTKEVAMTLLIYENDGAIVRAYEGIEESPMDYSTLIIRVESRDPNEPSWQGVIPGTMEKSGWDVFAGRRVRSLSGYIHNDSIDPFPPTPEFEVGINLFSEKLDSKRDMTIDTVLKAGLVPEMRGNRMFLTTGDKKPDWLEETEMIFEKVKT